MKTTDKTKEVLKRILQGDISRQEAEELLRAGAPAGFCIVLMDKDTGVYTVDEQQGLTEEEMKALIHPKQAIRVLTWAGMPPIAHSEKDIVM